MTESGALQLVSGDGEFNTAGVEAYLQSATRDADGQDVGMQYNVVAIMGPQSSGKSTLLNNLVRVWSACRACCRRCCICGSLEVLHRSARHCTFCWQGG